MTELNNNPKSYPRIRAIHLNAWERPRAATVWTKYGLVHARWSGPVDNRRWIAKGKPTAIEEASVAIEHIEQMCESMH